MTAKNARLTKFTSRLCERLNSLVGQNRKGWVILVTAPLVLTCWLIDGPDDYDRDFNFRGRAQPDAEIAAQPESRNARVFGDELPVLLLAAILWPPTWIAGKLGIIEY